MAGRILLLVFEILVVYFVLRWAYRAWKKAPIKEKFDVANDIENDHTKILEFESRHNGLSERNKKVAEFKNKKDF